MLTAYRVYCSEYEPTNAENSTQENYHGLAVLFRHPFCFAPSVHKSAYGKRYNAARSYYEYSSVSYS